MNITHPRLAGMGAAVAVSAAIVLPSLGGAQAPAAKAAAAPAAPITARITEKTVRFSQPLHAGRLRLHVVSTGVEPHHLIFWQLHRGVTFKRFAAVSDKGDPFKLASIAGGNGQLAPGNTMDIWLRLARGRVVILDIPAGDGKGFTRDVVIRRGGTSAPVPDALGTVTATVADRYALPSGFGAPGVWKFANADADPHEASIVRLAAGRTVTDLIAWARKGEHGFPPIDGLSHGVWGGFGALAGHRDGWFSVGTLPAGRYALVCFLPGPDGMPHLAMGMAAPFQVP